MKRCGSCGEPARALGLLHVNEGGKLRRVRACRKCRKSAVAIAASAPAARCACGAAATTCGRCDFDRDRRDRAKDLIEQIKMCRGRARAYRVELEQLRLGPHDTGAAEQRSYLRGLAEAWEAAADTLATGARP